MIKSENFISKLLNAKLLNAWTNSISNFVFYKQVFYTKAVIKMINDLATSIFFFFQKACIKNILV